MGDRLLKSPRSLLNRKYVNLINDDHMLIHDLIRSPSIEAPSWKPIYEQTQRALAQSKHEQWREQLLQPNSTVKQSEQILLELDRNRNAYQPDSEPLEGGGVELTNSSLVEAATSSTSLKQLVKEQTAGAAQQSVSAIQESGLSTTSGSVWYKTTVRTQSPEGIIIESRVERNFDIPSDVLADNRYLTLLDRKDEHAIRLDGLHGHREDNDNMSPNINFTTRICVTRSPDTMFSPSESVGENGTHLGSSTMPLGASAVTPIRPDFSVESPVSPQHHPLKLKAVNIEQHQHHHHQQQQEEQQQHLLEEQQQYQSQQQMQEQQPDQTQKQPHQQQPFEIEHQHQQHMQQAQSEEQQSIHNQVQQELCQDSSMQEQQVLPQLNQTAQSQRQTPDNPTFTDSTVDVPEQHPMHNEGPILTKPPSSEGENNQRIDNSDVHMDTGGVILCLAQTKPLTKVCKITSGARTQIENLRHALNTICNDLAAIQEGILRRDFAACAAFRDRIRIVPAILSELIPKLEYSPYEKDLWKAQEGLIRVLDEVKTQPSMILLRLVEVGFYIFEVGCLLGENVLPSCFAPQVHAIQSRVHRLSAGRVVRQIIYVPKSFDPIVATYYKDRRLERIENFCSCQVRLLDPSHPRAAYCPPDCRTLEVNYDPIRGKYIGFLDLLNRCVDSKRCLARIAATVMRRANGAELELRGYELLQLRSVEPRPRLIEIRAELCTGPKQCVNLSEAAFANEVLSNPNNPS